MDFDPVYKLIDSPTAAVMLVFALYCVLVACWLLGKKGEVLWDPKKCYPRYFAAGEEVKDRNGTVLKKAVGRRQAGAAFVSLALALSFVGLSTARLYDLFGKPSDAKKEEAQKESPPTAKKQPIPWNPLFPVELKEVGDLIELLKEMNPKKGESHSFSVMDNSVRVGLPPSRFSDQTLASYKDKLVQKSKSDSAAEILLVYINYSRDEKWGDDLFSISVLFTLNGKEFEFKCGSYSDVTTRRYLSGLIEGLRSDCHEGLQKKDAALMK